MAWTIWNAPSDRDYQEQFNSYPKEEEEESMSEPKWFMFDQENGFSVEEFDAEEAALKAAADAIAEYLDSDGWGEGVERIIVGKITHQVKEIRLPLPEDVREAIEEDPAYKPPYDYYCKYEMEPVEPLRNKLPHNEGPNL